MGLDIRVYEIHEETLYDTISKQIVNHTGVGSEQFNLGRNYPFMEWFEKKLGCKIENGTCYIVYFDWIDDLLRDCREIFRLVNDCNRKNDRDEELTFSEKVISAFKEKFPNENWNKEDRCGYDTENYQAIMKPHEFTCWDYYDMERVYEHFSRLRDKAYIICPDW